MNQILFTNNNNNNYNKVDTKKIIGFFAIAILLIAIIIVSIKTYGMYKKRKDNLTETKAEISISTDNLEETTIRIAWKDGIKYLVYTWNDEDENKVVLNGSTSFERIIEIPDNPINTLKLEVTSINNVTTTKTEVFEKNTNTSKPIVDSITIIDKKLNIEVSDDNGIKYLAYQWENEEEVIIEAPEEDNKKMTAEIDIQRGTYKLQIRIVNIDNVEEKLSRLITGVNTPEISVIKYGDRINVSVTHDRGFKRIEFIINNTLYVYDEEYSKYDKNKTTVEFEFPLQQGENLVQIKAYSLEKLTEDGEEKLENYSSKTYTGKCTYEP